MSFRRYAVAGLALVALVPISQIAFADTQPQPPQRPTFKQFAGAARKHAAQQKFDPHTVLVRFKSGLSATTKNKALSKRSVSSLGAVEGTGFVKVHTDGSAADALRQLRADPAVSAASLDYKRQITATPNDPGYTYGDQDYLKTVRVPQAWDRTKGSTAQLIAVVDTGVNGAHEDLKGRTVAGYNAITNTAIAAGAKSDDNGHGSMVAGIAAANTNNSIGVAGVAWTGRVMPVKALDKEGSGWDSDIARGVTWAADHGAKVINLSLGGPDDDAVLHDAIKYATNKGALVVVAAGNSGDNAPQYPAVYPEVLAVGATDHAGNLTDFSTYGDWVDVAAPGYAIVSTGPGLDPANGPGEDYYIGDGTSFAAPIVSGVAALVRSEYPALTVGQVISRLKLTARDAGPRGLDPYYGYGVVDAFAATGGAWTTDFPQRALGTGEPNDVPARATSFSGSVTGTFAVEGDADWYRFTSAGAPATVRVVPAVDDPQHWAQNANPALAVYDQDLHVVGQADTGSWGVPESLSLNLTAGTYYVKVRNVNGGADTRSYTLSVGSASGGSLPVGQQEWVRDASPADFATGQPVATQPTVTFQRDVDASSVTSDTVRLLSGRTGAAVAATVAYDSDTKTATLTPSAALQDNTPYRIVVSGLLDSTNTGQGAPYTSTFTTVNLAPAAVTNLKATGGTRAAALSWTLPSITDLDQVIVRMAAGNTAPSGPTAGTAVYAGTGSSATVTGLTSGATYTFAAWVRDRSGKYSPVATIQLLGTTLAINSSSTALTYGGSVTLYGRLIGPSNGAGVTGQPVQLYSRRKGTTAWTLLATVTSGTNGAVSFVNKPTYSTDYYWAFRNSTAYVGNASAVRTVGVSTTVSSTLSKTSFPLGGTVYIYGSVTPSHAGQTVYLQRYLGGGKWQNVTSRALSSTSGYSIAIKPTSKGTYYYRIYKPADTDHSAGYSPIRNFKVS
ncbi:S8 family serine peptidase [Actinoplanes sp. KI2]|uniref:S8 family serine peptidase n=1 Tax=Actinoplanes sp. KI2 TaxID=2983315 RepID=UPI0021D5CE65|nr:S8 family serine peptidase [Actinoplanes sp. KI2]MCU7722189.1 S8 family serine peptidase [Actinoplanes sp. KI2]